ncbi:MAG: PAS domain-containing protein, partial [Planctomycetia bacterium]
MAEVDPMSSKPDLVAGDHGRVEPAASWSFHDLMPVGLLHFRNGRFLLNDVAESILGRSESPAATADEWLRTVLRDDGESRRALDGPPTGFPEPVRASVVRGDGEIRTVEFVERRTVDEVVVAIRDVTESARLHRMLEQTQRAARVGGWQLDLRTKAVYWTAETHSLHDTDPVSYQPTLESAMAFYTPASASLLGSVLRCCQQTGEPFDLVLEIVTAAGRRVSVRVIGQPDLERLDGEVVRLYGSFQDVTAAKRLEAALRANEQRLRLALDAAAMISHSWDAAAESTKYSGDVRAFFHAPPDLDLDGPDGVFVLVHPDDRGRLAREVESAKVHRRDYQFEFRGAQPAPDGGDAWFCSRGRFVWDVDGRSAGRLGVTTNVTQGKRNELERRRLEQRLREHQHLESLGVLA